MKNHVNWRKYIVLCLLSVAIMFGFTIRPADAASGKDMKIDHRKDTQWSSLWDYVIDRDQVEGKDILFPFSGGQPYVIKKDSGEATIRFWVIDSQNFGGLDGFRMFLGRGVLNADGKTKHFEAIKEAPGSDENGFYYTKNGKIEITVSREDLPKVIKGSADESIREYQTRVQKYGEGGGYWTIVRAYDIAPNVLGVYNEYYGKWPMPSNYTDTDYWAGEIWGSVIYDVYDKKNQRSIFDMTTQSYTAQPGETFDCTNQDDLRKLVASFTEWQGAHNKETKGLKGDELLHQVDLKDELIRNSKKHKIEYEALKITPINGTPALQEGQTTLTQEGTYEIELRGYYERNTTYPSRYRFVTKKATVTIPFPDVIPEKDENGELNRKPDNYVPVTFESDGNGTLSGETKYYVNPAKEVDLTDYAAAITKTPKVGFKAEGKWDPEQLKNTFATATKFVFRFTPYDDVIEVKPNEPKPIKPDGYVEVTFKADENGKLSGTTLYYVNPTKKVTLTPPHTIGNTGYVFAAWSQDVTKETQYESATTVTASFKQIEPVQTKETPGYVKVNFVIVGEGGSILDGERTTYWVDPNREVTLTAPQYDTSVGYKFEQWSPNPQTSRRYMRDTTIRGTFRALADVIEVKPNEPKPTKPDSYVDVIFDTDGNGTLSGTTLYYVNPKKMVKLTPPKTMGNTGYVFASWSQDVTQATQYKSATIVTASFNRIDAVQTKETPGYVKVNFVIVGEGGSIRNGETTTYWVDPNREVTLTAPKYDTMVGYKFEQWNPDPQTAQQYATETTIKGTFRALGDVIEEKPNETRPEGYVTVKTLPTDKAENKDDTQKTYWVKKNAAVTLPVAEPIGKTETDAQNLERTYHFIGWTVTKGTIASWLKPDSGSTVIADSFIQDTEITAQYSASVKPGDLVAAPVAKKDVTTPVGSVPEAKTLIANADALPEGTTFAFAQQPDVSKAGMTQAQVSVTYPNGKTVLVTAPLKVIAGEPTVQTITTYVGRLPEPKDYKAAIEPAGGAAIETIAIEEYPDVAQAHSPENPSIAKVKIHYKDGSIHLLDVPVVVNANVIPATEDGSKPEGTPENYVKVIVDPTEKAEDPTQSIFYVNPEVVVHLPVDDPVGREVSAANAMSAPQNVAMFNVEDGDEVESAAPENATSEENALEQEVSEEAEPALEESVSENLPSEESAASDDELEISEAAAPVAVSEGASTHYVFKNWDKPITDQFRQETTITALYDLVALPIQPLPEVPVGWLVTTVGVTPQLNDYDQPGVVAKPEGSTLSFVHADDYPEGEEKQAMQEHEKAFEKAIQNGGSTFTYIRVTFADGSSRVVRVPVYVLVPCKNPENPDNPNPPVNPDNPDQPNPPVDPENPDNPKPPVNPENPNQPNPQDPSQPNRPMNPRNSNQSRPQGGTAQGARVGGSPKTGDNIASVAGVGILAAAALYVSRRKNRQHANESK